MLWKGKKTLYLNFCCLIYFVKLQSHYKNKNKFCSFSSSPWEGDVDGSDAAITGKTETLI